MPPIPEWKRSWALLNWLVESCSMHPVALDRWAGGRKCEGSGSKEKQSCHCVYLVESKRQPYRVYHPPVVLSSLFPTDSSN